MLTILPLGGVPEIEPGAKLGSILAEAIAPLDPVEGDVLVVTQKIVSKAEDRFVSLRDVKPSHEARVLADKTAKDPRLVELVLRESIEVVRAVRGVLITRHRSGHVMANAGIDQSNLGPSDGEKVLLLPDNSDDSAAEIRKHLIDRFGKPLGVIVSDSFGRPWRHGVTCVAIGAAGLPALHDRRGETDRDGRILEVTQIGLADMAACAAGLAMGEGAEGIPAALVRGIAIDVAPHCPAAALVRPLEEDLFR